MKQKHAYNKEHRNLFADVLRRVIADHGTKQTPDCSDTTTADFALRPSPSIVAKCRERGNDVNAVVEYFKAHPSEL